MTQSGESIDPRVRRTRTALIDAVLELAAERDFNEIGVSEIVRLAGVSRSVFYLHYKDKHELVVAALDSLFDELTQEVLLPGEARAVLDPDNVPAPFIRQLLHIKSRSDLFRRLMDETGSSAFAARLRQYFRDQNMRAWTALGVRAAPGSRPLELRAASAAGAGMSGIRWWLEDGESVDVERIAEWLWKHAIAVYAFSAEELAELSIPAERG